MEDVKKTDAIPEIQDAELDAVAGGNFLDDLWAPPLCNSCKTRNAERGSEFCKECGDRIARERHKYIVPR